MSSVSLLSHPQGSISSSTYLGSKPASLSFMGNSSQMVNNSFSSDESSHSPEEDSKRDCGSAFETGENTDELVSNPDSGEAGNIHTGSLSLSVSTVSNNQILTIRMLMSGKEVGSIIGKRGENVKKYREESNSRINISDGSCPERIVTVTGTMDQISHAYSMICQKFEDDFTQSLIRNCQPEDISCPPVTLRLLVPATQCGSIIGRGGCKIKEIRELTGASIQVAIELLPNSNERTVTVSGTAKAISRCIKQLCQIILETPLKGPAFPYRPKPPTENFALISFSGNSVIINPQIVASADVNATSLGDMVNSDPINNSHNNPESTSNGSNLSLSPANFGRVFLTPQASEAIYDPAVLSTAQISPQTSILDSTNNHTSTLIAHNPPSPTCDPSTLEAAIQQQQFLAMMALTAPYNQNLLLNQNGGLLNTFYSPQSPAARHPTAEALKHNDAFQFTSPPLLNPPNNAAIFMDSIRRLNLPAQINGDHKQELVIPNELIGCIIGRGGNKINEIRQASQATIKISCGEDGASNRRVTISGNIQAVQTAQILINNRPRL